MDPLAYISATTLCPELQPKAIRPVHAVWGSAIGLPPENRMLSSESHQYRTPELEISLTLGGLTTILLGDSRAEGNVVFQANIGIIFLFPKP